MCMLARLSTTCGFEVAILDNILVSAQLEQTMRGHAPMHS